MWQHRKYKSGTDWCLWRWTRVPSEFITRLHVVMIAGYALMVHWIDRPDPEPFRHDHPVTFLSLIAKGWYVEDRLTNGKLRERKKRSWFNFIKASPSDRHRIIEVAVGGAVTIVFAAPASRNWGYHTVYPEWTYWRDYQAAERKAAEQGGSWRDHLVPTITDKHNHHK